LQAICGLSEQEDDPMRKLLLAAAAIGGMSGLAGGAMAAPGWHDGGPQMTREGGSRQHVVPGESRVTPVDYYHNRHRYHHRKWHHGRWHYWD
jgi:hypothetical protein